MSGIIMPVTPLLAVDALMLHRVKLTVIERLCNPHGLAWPGGFVDVGETVEQAMVREVLEETNLESEIVELIGTYSEPNRDPRGHVVSIVFLCRSAGCRSAMPKDDASDLRFFTIQNALKIKMEFDHNQMLLDALDRTSLNRRRI